MARGLTARELAAGAGPLAPGYTSRMLVARRFVVTGRVQGVGFRWFVQELAAIEGVAGWVLNRPDGSVELVVQGDTESVQRIGAKIRRGPPGARVDHVEVADEPPLDSLKSFSIRS